MNVYMKLAIFYAIITVVFVVMALSYMRIDRSLDVQYATEDGTQVEEGSKEEGF